MMQTKSILLLSISTIYFLSIACRNQLKTRESLVKYLGDTSHGLVQVDSIGHLKVTLSFRPWQLLGRDLHKSKETSSNSFNDVLKQRYNFVLSFSANNKEILTQLPFNQYSELVQVFSFRMGDFISVTPDNSNAISPINCSFQETYGLSTANDLLISYDRSKLANSSILRFKIKEFGLNTGDLYFTMKTDDINQLLDHCSF